VRLPVGVRYLSVVAGTGYGDSAEHYVAGLRRRCPVSWIPIEGDQAAQLASLHRDIQNARVPYDTVVLHMRPDEMSAWLDREHLKIGYVAWEADRAPDDWRPVLDQLDLVLVPSEFNRRVVADATDSPVATLPHIARRVRPVVDDKGFGTITDDDFVFYTIGTWHNRKALPETIRAFLDTFSSDDAVALIVKTTAFDYEALAALQSGRELEGGPRGAMSWWSLARILRDYPHPPKLFLQAEDVDVEAIDRIHTRGDCYLSLARGEGWGLGSFDAALFGNPSIATGWGGHLDYLGTDYPLLVDYVLVPTSSDPTDAFAFPVSDDRRWARFDADHARTLMRHVYEHRDEAAALGRELRAKLVDRYSSVVVTSRLISLIAETHDSGFVG
jgi:glycosyltransferase involved in cell wall biosynthesis